jgi:hypothetical protein
MEKVKLPKITEYETRQSEQRFSGADLAVKCSTCSEDSSSNCSSTNRKHSRRRPGAKAKAAAITLVQEMQQLVLVLL